MRGLVANEFQMLSTIHWIFFYKDTFKWKEQEQPSCLANIFIMYV